MWETFTFSASSSSFILCFGYKTVLFYSGPILRGFDGDDPTKRAVHNVNVTQINKNLPHNFPEYGGKPFLSLGP